MALARRQSSKISAEESTPELNNDEYNIYESSYVHKHWPQPPVSKPNPKNGKRTVLESKFCIGHFQVITPVVHKITQGRTLVLQWSVLLDLLSQQIFIIIMSASIGERNMKTPSERHSHEGTWGCGGNFV